MESCNATFTNISSRINLSTKEIDTSSLSCYCFDLSGNLGVNGYSAKKYVFGIVNPSTCMLRLDYVTKGGYQGTTFVPVGVALMNINNESVSSVVLTLEFLRIESGITATLKEWSETVVKDETAE
ncbi:MAG: hypothetical protein PHU00_07810 [Bacteroidales bacterium]|nr:hypothetical protein [Bacteroidales bacterium]